VIDVTDTKIPTEDRRRQVCQEQQPTPHNRAGRSIGRSSQSREGASVGRSVRQSRQRGTPTRETVTPEQPTNSREGTEVPGPREVQSTAENRQKRGGPATSQAGREVLGGTEQSIKQQISAATSREQQGRKHLCRNRSLVWRCKEETWCCRRAEVGSTRESMNGAAKPPPTNHVLQ
jgi:hypothetical protein